MKIQVPYKWTPRAYQVPSWHYMQNGGKRAVLIWHRRCLAAGTNVTMSDGSWKPIESVEVGDKVLTWVNGEYVVDEVTGSWCAGEKPTVKVSASGFPDIECTADHRFFMNRQGYLQGWTEIGDFMVKGAFGASNHVTMSTDYHAGSFNAPELAEFFGYMVTDGSCNENSQPKFTNTQMELLERVDFLAKKFGAVTKWREKGNGFDIGLSNGTAGGGEIPNPIKELFKKYNAFGNHGGRRAPDFLWYADKETVYRFFAAAIDGDGTVSVMPPKEAFGGKKIKTAYEVIFHAGESKSLALDYYWLLRKLGICASSVKYAKGSCWTVRVWRKSDAFELLKNTAPYIRHKDKKAKAIDILAGEKPKGRRVYKGFLSASISRVESSVQMTYDIETKNHHSFFANGYLVHNSGKDEWCLRWESVAAMQRPATYWHMLPEASQARKAIWDAINPHTGKRRIDEAFPMEIRQTTREQEMMIKFVNGATWQVVGSDNFNSLVGSPPAGVTFSEWALADPNAWAYLRPILAENGGWAVFQTTPRGENHGKTMYEFGVKEPSWYAEILPVTKTHVLTPEQIEAEKREYIHQYGKSRGLALFNQEFMCSFTAAFTGKAVYPDFDREYHVAKQPLLPIVQEGINNGHTVVVRGWDHSGLHPACVVTYMLGRTWYIFKEFWEEDAGIEDFAEMVKIWCAENLPSDAEFKDFGDPAGNRTRDSRKKTAADYIRAHCGISIKDGIQTFKVRVASVNKRLNLRDGLLVDPTECPITIDGFLGGYGYPEIGHSGVFKESISGKDKDHFCDCFVDGTLVTTQNGPVPIESISSGDVVKTPYGYRSVVDRWVKKENADNVVELKLSNGSNLRCTEDHEFFTFNRGMVPAAQLTENDELCQEGAELWLKVRKLLNSKGKNTGFLEDITRQEEDSKGLNLLPHFMSLFGNIIISEKFQKGTASTTLTTTQKTILYGIFTLCRSKLIKHTTVDTDLFSIVKKLCAELSQPKKKRPVGIDQKPVALGTLNMENVFGIQYATESLSAAIAEKSTNQDAPERNFGIVQPLVSRQQEDQEGTITNKDIVLFAEALLKLIDIQKQKLAVKLVHRSSVKELCRVHAMEVDTDHVFYAGGVLVKNCHDAIQYVATRLFISPLASQSKKIYTPPPLNSWTSL